MMNTPILHSPKYSPDAYRIKIVAWDMQAVSRNDIEKWKHIRGLQLADPKYLEPGHVDVLIGARVYAEIILPGLMKGPPNAPIAQLTKIGWILSGACETQSRNAEDPCNLAMCE